jgi:hypothetical protein
VGKSPASVFTAQAEATDSSSLKKTKEILLLLEALQLQRSFVLLNEFFPFGSVSDAVLPAVYSHVCYIIFTSSSHLFLCPPSGLVDMGVHSYTFFYYSIVWQAKYVSEPSFDVI